MEVPVFQVEEIAHLKSQRFRTSLGWMVEEQQGLIIQTCSDGGWVVDDELKWERRGSDDVQFITPTEVG